MQLNYPYMLWLLLLIPAMLIAGIRSGRSRRVLATATLLLSAAALVLALCDPRLARSVRHPVLVRVVDISPSISEEQLQAALQKSFDAVPEAKRAAHAADSAALAPLVVAALRPGDALLVKGSLGSRMARIIAALPLCQPSGRAETEEPA